jgi:hypothetical protein
MVGKIRRRNWRAIERIICCGRNEASWVNLIPEKIAATS